MIVFRPATFSDVEHIHKLLNYYAKEGLMLPRARNAIYENLRDYILAVENNRLLGCGALHFVWDRFAEIRSLAVGTKPAENRHRPSAGGAFGKGGH